MMIKVADVAELMQIDEKIVVRWIRKEGLPAVEVLKRFEASVTKKRDV